MSARRRKPEVLAPAGDADALRAAVRAGADAVYFGLQDWNARIRARNFSIEDLPETIADLHRDGVRAYVAFNTLLFSDEWPAAERALGRIAEAEPDAVIVQDLGVARFLHERFPSLAIHASTQMTISSSEGIELLRLFGVRRVILARELSLTEIRRIAQASPVELEVFVHGALCVSYSGQCLSSEAWGGRSANRGQCAQACRLPYDLIVDGRRHDLGDRAYLLSPRDLEGWDLLGELIEIGVAGIKIEGRMKSAEYVYASTRLYREAVDGAWEEAARAPAATERRGASVPGGPHTGPARLADRARRVFSRGPSAGFLAGIDHQRLVDGTARSHRGVLVGVVARAGRGFIEVERAAAEGGTATGVRAGDGVLVATGPLEEQETGGKAFAVEPAGPRRLRIRFGRVAAPDPRLLVPGAAVHLTHDDALQAELRRAVEDPERRKRIDLTIEARGGAGTPLEAVYRDPEGREAVALSRTALQEAAVHPLDRETLAAHLGRLGATRYRCARIEARLEGSLALPVSEMNRMRREAIERLEIMRARPQSDGPAVDEREGGTAAAAPMLDEREGGTAAAAPMLDEREAGTAAAAPAPHDPGPLPASPVEDAVRRAEALALESGSSPAAPAAPAPAPGGPFIVVCRSREQVDAALAAGAGRIGLDFLDLVGLKQACAAVREAEAELTLALPRVQKPGEERIWHFFLGRRPDAILARNLASIAHLAAAVRGGPGGEGPALIADVSLNAVNPEAIAVLLEAGCARVTPGLDLNGEQLLALLREAPADRIEVPLHHHLPVFHTEHCVFAAFLSRGADWRTCGRPCDRHALHLRDRVGQEHAVIADVGCRNTVFGARAQSVLDLLPRLRALGVAHYRLELLEQDARATAHLLDVYRRVWDGALPPAEGLRLLSADARFGIFGGSPEPPRDPGWKPRGGRRPARGGVR